MSKQLRLTVSDAYIEGLEAIALEDGHFNGTRIDVTTVVRTAIRKYLNRRGLRNEDIDKRDEK